MKSPVLIKVLGVVAIAFLSMQAHAIGGSIAVGLNNGSPLDGVQVSFMADATIETAEGTLTETIRYVPGMVRDDVLMSGQQMVFIQRFDLGKMWMLIDAQKVYIETDMTESSDQLEQYQLVEREVMGQETVNGMDTTKYKVIYKSAKGKYGGFAWFTDDMIAVKAFLISEADGEKQRIKFEITELTRGPQDRSLFELPAGYGRLDLGAMSGKNLPGFGGGGFADRMGDVAKQAAEQQAATKVRHKVGRFFKKVFKN